MCLSPRLFLRFLFWDHTSLTILPLTSYYPLSAQLLNLGRSSSYWSKTKQNTSTLTTPWATGLSLPPSLILPPPSSPYLCLSSRKNRHRFIAFIVASPSHTPYPSAQLSSVTENSFHLSCKGAPLSWLEGAQCQAPGPPLFAPTPRPSCHLSAARF